MSLASMKDLTFPGRIPFGRPYKGRRSWTSVIELRGRDGGWRLVRERLKWDFDMKKRKRREREIERRYAEAEAIDDAEERR